eukprot:ctg_1114.g459
MGAGPTLAGTADTTAARAAGVAVRGGKARLSAVGKLSGGEEGGGTLPWMHRVDSGSGYSRVSATPEVLAGDSLTGGSAYWESLTASSASGDSNAAPLVSPRAADDEWGDWFGTLPTSGALLERPASPISVVSGGLPAAADAAAAPSLEACESLDEIHSEALQMPAFLLGEVPFTDGSEASDEGAALMHTPLDRSLYVASGAEHGQQRVPGDWSATVATAEDEAADFSTLFHRQAEIIRKLETELSRSRAQVTTLQRLLELAKAEANGGNMSPMPRMIVGGGAMTFSVPAKDDTASGASISPVTPTYVCGAPVMLNAMNGTAASLHPVPNMDAVGGRRRWPSCLSKSGRSASSASMAASERPAKRQCTPTMVNDIVMRSSNSAGNLLALEPGVTPSTNVEERMRMSTGAAVPSCASAEVDNGEGQISAVPAAILPSTAAADLSTDSDADTAPYHDGTFLFPSKQAAFACAAAREVFGSAAEALEKQACRRMLASVVRRRHRRPSAKDAASAAIHGDGAGVPLDAAAAATIDALRKGTRNNANARPLGSTRYWVPIEHELCLLGCRRYGPKNFAAIASIVQSRSAKQVRTHLQKYQVKVWREAQRMRNEDGGAALAQLEALTCLSLSSHADALQWQEEEEEEEESNSGHVDELEEDVQQMMNGTGESTDAVPMTTTTTTTADAPETASG